MQQTSSTTTPTREPDAAIDGAPATFARIFVPIDYTMDCHRALGLALALQKVYRSEICLFHTAKGDGGDDWHGGIGADFVAGDWVTRAKRRLEHFVENVAPEAKGLVELNARTGGETIRIVHDEAKRWGATLVIAAASVHSRLTRSSAEKLIHDLELPTLIVPATG